MEYLVYKHTSPSGKSYIGITKNYAKRCSTHKTSTFCRAFRAAIDKYGWDNFTHEVLLTGLSLPEANEAEARFILEYNTMSPNGYNLTTGGEVYTMSEETKNKISEATKGRKLSEETKLKMANARRGKPLSKATKDKMAQIRGTSSYIVTDPNLNTYVVDNLCEFCRCHHLTYTGMIDVARKRRPHHKKWLCAYADQ